MRRSWSRGLYPHGLLCGFLMSVFAFWAHGRDVPALPLVAVVLCTPYFVLSGLLAGRRDGLDAGMVAGAATALSGYTIVTVVTICYTALSQPWPQSLLWVVLGVMFVFLPILVGAFRGLLGGAVGKYVRL